MRWQRGGSHLLAGSSALSMTDRKPKFSKNSFTRKPVSTVFTNTITWRGVGAACESSFLRSFGAESTGFTVNRTMIRVCHGATHNTQPGYSPLSELGRFSHPLREHQVVEVYDVRHLG